MHTTHWAFTTSGMVRSSPTVVDGIVYFGSDDGGLYAVDARSGEKRWSFTTGRKVRSSPAVVDGVVYVGSDNGKLHAVDADTGRERWSFHTKARLRSSPAMANGIVYIASARVAKITDRDVMPKPYAVDAATGRERWSSEIGSNEVLSPVVANGIVYVAFSSVRCRRIPGYSTGSTLWATARRRRRWSPMESCTSPMRPTRCMPCRHKAGAAVNSGSRPRAVGHKAA